MATSQTSADSPTVGLVSEKDAGGFEYTPLGGIRFYTGDGAPNHTSGVIGSLYVDKANHILYINTSGASWTEIA